ncbi:MAG: histidine--tRNA ligase [Polymorphobacter sp.]|uniref:histidine--tRNA ligase n=1 Tax=Polymorphobacter sp. TaxID=1909290 RepID=UPI003A85F2F0
MSRLQKPRGTQDLFGESVERFDHVVRTFDRVRKLYGFGRVEVPVFEATAVFARGLGETTDVVSKEMYEFEDRGGDSLTLRPEFTAGIARAFVENGWQQFAPVKLATWGPLFRYERPQKGRFRQFHQLDAEILGAGEPAADVELLAMAQQLLEELRVADRVVLQLNTLGDAETRVAWRAALVDHFSKHLDVLSDESRVRLEKNPLRILDSKAESDRALVAAAPGIDAYMSAEAGAFFESVLKGLEASGVAYVRNAALVRGFDYYRHTAFEFVTDALGAQGTVIGGGRYDGLVGMMGGPETPAVGWAGGIERLSDLLDRGYHPPRIWTLIAENEAALEATYAIARYLRHFKINIDTIYGSNLRKLSSKARKRDVSGIIYFDEGRDGYDFILKFSGVRRNDILEFLRLKNLLDKDFFVEEILIVEDKIVKNYLAQVLLDGELERGARKALGFRFSKNVDH